MPDLHPILGQLEEMILLIVLIIQEEAYGVSVAEEYRTRSGRNISIPAVHTVLKRLEKKGLLRSRMGGATAERGGRKKRLFEITPYGLASLEEIKELRRQLWSAAPNPGLEL